MIITLCVCRACPLNTRLATQKSLKACTYNEHEGSNPCCHSIAQGTATGGATRYEVSEAMNKENSASHV
jgi:hypothetical protein